MMLVEKMRAKYLLSRGRFAEAFNLLIKLGARCAQNVWLLNSLGVACIFTGRIDKAQAFLDKALAINPGNTSVLNNLANLLLIKGKPGEARKIYLEILKINQWAQEPRYNLTLLYQILNRFEDALSCYDEYVTVKMLVKWLKILGLSGCILLLLRIVR